MLKSITSSELLKQHQRIEGYFETQERLKLLPGPIGMLEGAFRITPDEWQRRYLQSSTSSAAIAVVACRQTGKSTVAAAFAAWCMLSFPNFMIIICSRSLRQASEFMVKVKEAMFHYVPSSYAVHNNTLGLALQNGSRILSVPCQGADAARGFSPDLLLVDEAAFVGDDVFTALMPSLAATRGALHMISSPNGPVGKFYDAVEGVAADDFVNFRVRASETQRFDPNFLAMQKKLMGDIRYRQEYEAEFLTMEGAFFNAETTRFIFEGEEVDEADMEVVDYEGLMRVEVSAMTAALDRVQYRRGPSFYA